MDVYKFICKKVKENRHSLSLQQNELALHLQISVKRFKRIENGEAKYGLPLLYHMAEVFGIKPNELLKGYKHNIIRKS